MEAVNSAGFTSTVVWFLINRSKLFSVVICKAESPKITPHMLKLLSWWLETCKIHLEHKDWCLHSYNKAMLPEGDMHRKYKQLSFSCTSLYGLTCRYLPTCVFEMIGIFMLWLWSLVFLLFLFKVSKMYLDLYSWLKREKRGGLGSLKEVSAPSSSHVFKFHVKKSKQNCRVSNEVTIPLVSVIYSTLASL